MQSNKALSFLAPPDLVLRLVRSHRGASVGALVERIESGDVEEDLVARIQKLRRALHIIEWPVRPGGQATIIAKRALHADDAAERELRAEYGRGVGDLDDPPEERDDDLVEPAVGEVWRDALGAKHRVVELNDDDYAVKVATIAPPSEWIEIGDLTTHRKPSARGVCRSLTGPGLEAQPGGLPP